jgi:hypothetical protein
MTASVAEVAVGRIGFVAFGAGDLQFAAALVAEAGVGRIIGLALGALHFSFFHLKKYTTLRHMNK